MIDQVQNLLLQHIIDRQSGHLWRWDKFSNCKAGHLMIRKQNLPAKNILSRVIVLFVLIAVAFAMAAGKVSANEVEATDRLYNLHQQQSLAAAHKLQKLRQDYDGHLESAPATLVVPLIDEAVSHMRWARAYAPNEDSRKILKFNEDNLKRLRKTIMDGQSAKPRKKGVCTGDDKWITA
jgi:hypothetical protein